MSGKANAAKIALAAMAGQAIYLLASPIISRLVPPDAFGVYALYAALLGIVSVCATGKFELAIPLANRQPVAARLAALSLGLALAVVAAIFLTFLLLDQTQLLAESYGIEMRFVILLCGGVLAICVLQVLTFLAIRSGDFTGVAAARFTNGASLAGSHVLFGVLGLGAVGLIAGQILSHILSAATLRRSIRIIGTAKATGVLLRKTISRYRRFPTYSAPAAVINAGTVRAPAALLTLSYDERVGGAFLFCQTVLSAPVMLFGRAVGQVYIGKLAEKRRSAENDIPKLLRWIAVRLFLFALVPSAVIAFAGEWLFGTVFGENWVLAGQIAEIMSIVILVEFVVIPIGQTLELIERQEVQLYWDGFRLTGVLAIFWISHKMQLSVLTTISYYAVFIVGCYLLFLSFIFTMSKSNGPNG